MRETRSLFVPLLLTIGIMGITIGLMVWWIISKAQNASWTGLTLGTIAFSLVLIGSSFYLVIIIKERHLIRRQINFVDSVTHELKTPIASLRLYLETLMLRTLEPEKRDEFYQTMDNELSRLDEMISQLLQVARLDAIGQESPISDVPIESLLQNCADVACSRYKLEPGEVFELQLQPGTIHGPLIALEMIFRNLFDNAIKYGGENPHVEVTLNPARNDRVSVQITDNGEGVPFELRKKIFKLFFRAGNELERKQKGTGVGLYIVQTLVRKLGGQILVEDRKGQSGCVIRIELPGKFEKP